MKKTVKKNYFLYIFTAAVLAELFLTFYLKLDLNGLSWKDFNIFYFGNIFNIVLSLLLIIGVVIIFYFRKELKAVDRYVILILSVASLIPLVLILFFEQLKITFPEGYIFNYPVQKVYLAFLFILSECLQIFTFFVIWLIIFSYKDFSFLNSLFYSAASIIFLMMFSYFYTTGAITNLKEINENGEYDVGVILGAAVWSKNQPSPIFKQRIEKTFELYKSGKIKKIHVTGGNAPGEISEAESAKKYLIDLGMNEKDILFESATSTTSEQIRYIKNTLVEKQGMRKILIISDHFHLKRVLEMCKFFNVNAEGIQSGYKLNWKKLLYYRVRDSIGLLLFWLFAI